MKKLLSLFVPLMALFLTLAPQTARAQVNEYLSFYCSWASSTVTPTAVGTPDVNLEYSTDKANWTPVTMGTAIDIHTAKVYFRGNNPDGFSKSMTDYVWFNIYVSSYTCTVAGNVMSLVGGAAFAANSTTIPNDYCFYRLFSSGASVSNNSINASALTLPANNLTTGCYREMFYYTNIVNLPQLPAQNLADYCYYRMFYRCKSIATMTTEGVNYVLPAEELKPHCYEYMFGYYSESPSTTFRCEIMATSCQDRTGNDIEKCLANIFNFEVNGTKSWNVYLTIYFKTLGTTSSTTCPTYYWFAGGKNTSRNYIYHDSGINSTSKRTSSSNNSPVGAFPYGCTLYSTSYTYLTFDCKTNGGTWESGSAYNTDLRRVVRANYTAKTIPAPPVKANARFLGWFTSASGDGSLLTEEYLKTVTTATTVYARFVDNDKYTFFVNPSDKATITVTDNSSNSYTPGTLYILDSNDKTFTLSCTGVTSGYTFYRWLGGLVDGNTVQFREGQKDMVVTGVITAAPAFGSASVTVYQVGTGAGTSSVVPLPSEAVDLGDAGIWAKYNVDNTQSNGFAASETATGGYYSWGMETAATASEVNALYSSMADGDNLPVTEEADVAYKYCGHKWRIPTKDEWQTLLDNTTVVGPTNTNNNNSTVSGKMQTFTSNSNGNQMILPPNGYYSGTTGPYFGNSIQYWSSTRGLTQSKGNTAYGYGGGLSSSTILAPTLGNTTVGGSGTGYYYYAVGIRPILNVNKRVLTVHTLDFDDDEQPFYHHYFFDADLNQSITVTAVEDDGNVFDHWEDSEGNLFSEDNPLEVRMYDNIELTAVFEAGSLVEHHVTFYDEDGSTVLWEDDYREGKKPVYHGDTPTKAGYVFNGWSPAITKLGDSDTYYTATYIQVFTVTASAAHGTVTITPGDPSDQVSENVYKTGTTLTLAVTPDAGWVFTQWTGGNSSNPRSVSVTGDASYTAEFRLESLPAVVDAYQSAPKDVKQILYLLAAQTGDDDKTYTPVDLGVGVAFADRNVGANNTSDVGGYYMWGKTTAATSGFSSSNQLSATGLYDGYTLTAEQDAATQNMGSHWRMPTDDEWVELKNTAVISADKSTFTNPQDGTKHITLPASGYYSSSTKYQSSYRFYWSSVTYYLNSSNIYPWTLENYETNSAYAVSVTYNNSNYINRYYGMPVRAVYVPSYTPVTLTINAGERQYIYYCQPGQQVTVTAHPNTAANYLFDEWEDNHSTNPERTFTVTANATYTAKMKDNPLATSHSVTFQDYDGTLLQSYDLIDGRNPVYSGAALKRKGYLFSGWTDANDVFTASGTPLPALTGDVVYTAIYVNNPYFTITNNHATTATSVSMKESNSNMTNKTFHVRILNAAGEVTTDWTSITVSGTGGTSFGSIPAGGMMLIYGNGGNTATSNYYDYFVISGGTPEISGNILALVACSNGETVNNSYSLPTYCFRYLFTDCTAITNAEDLELPSTTLSQYCYGYMFNGCTGLQKAPKELPATTLGTYCYYYMFNGCSNLEKAPEIRATSLANYCMRNMFYNCSKLKHIRYHGTVLGTSTQKTYYWVSGVPQTGDFYCPPELSRTYGTDYIPKTSTYKWTVYSYNVTFNPVECTWKDATVSSKQFTWETDVKNVTDFIDLEALAGAVFYTDAACTSEISVSAITAALATQKEASAATTKNYYVKKAPTLQVLTWDVNGGSSLTGDYTHGEIYSGTDVTAPADPTRDGFEFGGWDAGDDGIADEVVTIMPGDDITYTAIWRQIFTITFKDAENNTLQSGGVTEGSVPVFSGDIPVKASADPDHVWNFTGWTDGNANFTANGTPLPAVTGNTVYTATYAYEMNYLTFTNTHASQTLTVQLKRGSNPPTNVTLNYRVISANGTAGAWQVLTTVNNTTTYTVGEIPAGARMQLYGSNPSGFGQSTMNYWKFYFGTTGSAVLSGDLMSIFSGTVSSFDRSQTLPSYAFYGLFYENSAGNPRILSAKDLKLSATNLGQHCYHNMFYGCSNMTDAPQLSATTLAAYCYQNMFSYCSSLTAAPTLPATTLADYCYYSMFSYCTSLTTDPQLSVTTLTEGCYQSMFQGCTALVNVQNLPGTNLPKNCYSEMFSGCTALTTAPEIMAAEDAVPGIAACNSMFNGCTALTKAPSVLKPRTITVNQAYYNMFLNCTSLQRGPDVWATSITSGKTALYGLYQNASNVRHIRVHFTAWGASSFCGQWVYGVSPTGEFYCPPELPRTYSSTSYWNQAPRSTQDPWTIYSYDVTFVPVGGNWADGTNTNKQFTWRTDKSDIDDFIAAQVDGENNSIIQGWFLDAACTVATTEEAVKADLSVQQTTATKYVYVRLSGGSSTLTWNFNGGSTTSTESQYTFGTLNEGDPITAPANPTLAGFEFVGWDAGNDGVADDVATTMPSSDLTYTAIWRQIYTITYEGLNGATNSNPSSYTVVTPTITLANPGTRTGYTFTGWTCGGNPITQITIGSTGDKTITANWSADTYNLTYEGLNGATNSNPATYTIETATFALANPGTRTGYTFTGWTCGGNPITQITIGSTGNKTITAVWTANTHNVSWVTDGNALTGEYTNGTTAYGTTIVAPATPTKNATAEYTYTFNGWSPAVAATMPDNDVEYTATWTETPVSYTLTWSTNGDALTGGYTSGTVAYGTAIVAPATPTKTGHTFAGWDAGNDGVADDVAATMPAANTTYTAIWTANQHNISWVTDGNTLTGDYTNGTTAYGTTIVAPETPTKDATAQYTYTFNGWSPAVAATMPDNDVTYTATWTETPVGYTLTWTTDGNDLTGDYTHGTVAYGTTIVAPATPTKDATAEYTYAFNGWSPAVAATMPAANTEYTATWTKTPVNYTLTWSTDGDELTGEYTSGTVAYGTTIVAPATPTKSGYTFNGWSPAVDATMPAANTTYTATWTALLATIELLDNENNDYYTTFKAAHHNETANVRYTRTFGQGRWATLCLPFNVTSGQMTALKMKGRVYEFNHAEGSADIGKEVTLYFSAAKSLEAGKCYIVNANSALAGMSSFTFSNVTINLAADNGENLSGAGAYDALPGYKQSGNIELVGTLRKGTLKGSLAGYTYMGLKDNKIYYPNTDQGSTVLAYRGVFRDISGSSMMERVRIVVDGEDAGELEVVNGELQVPEARKFIQDGVLYIEREGVIYDATGKLIIEN